MVSTHAPVKGATESNRYLPGVWTCFNPRPREGGDDQPARLAPFPIRFNPRPREGGDGLPSHNPLRTHGFNPRPREGGDHRSGNLSG